MPESPLEDGEAPINLELKTVTSKSQYQIDAQLRANMLLSATHSFYSALLNTPPLRIEECITRTSKLSSFGITFGVHSMIVVYKLIIDFKANKLHYEERFRHPDSPSYAHVIDCGLSYVLRRVSTWDEDC